MFDARSTCILWTLVLTACTSSTTPSSKPSPAPTTNSATAYRVNDHVRYHYWGAHLGDSVILDERITSQQGNRLRIEVTAQKGAQRKSWVQVVTDTPENQRNNIIDELYEVIDGKEVPLDAKDPRALLKLYGWTLPPSVKSAGKPSTSKTSARLGANWHTCTQTLNPVTVGGRPATMRTSTCPDFVWTHGPASLVTNEGALLWSVTVTAQSREEPSSTAQIAGWEGFFGSSSTADADWRARHGLPLTSQVLSSVHARTVKLVLFGGTKKARKADLDKRFAMTCTDPQTKLWNMDRCRGLEKRRCEDDTCTYEHYGNCSGFVLEGNTVVTAAHCMAGIRDNKKHAQRSRILIAQTGGAPLTAKLGAIRVGKKDFSHHWVAVEEPSAVDVARVEAKAPIDLPTWPIGRVPEVGRLVFIHGYPRVEGRSEEARSERGYSLSAGVPVFSFGKISNRNEGKLALCNVDGNQEHWQLAAECPVSKVTVEGTPTWKGPITQSPFVGTWDSCNGYSGAPLFDGKGRWIGVNATLMSPHSPQEKYSARMFQVAIPADVALTKLGLRVGDD